jgi:hypothetical protein
MLRSTCERILRSLNEDEKPQRLAQVMRQTADLVLAEDAAGVTARDVRRRRPSRIRLDWWVYTTVACALQFEAGGIAPGDAQVYEAVESIILRLWGNRSPQQTLPPAEVFDAVLRWGAGRRSVALST